MTLFQTDVSKWTGRLSTSRLRSSAKTIDTADIKKTAILQKIKPLTFPSKCMLSQISHHLKPPFPRVSTMNGILVLTNLLLPPGYDMVSDRRPNKPFSSTWRIGTPSWNINNSLQLIRNRNSPSIRASAIPLIRPPGIRCHFHCSFRTGNCEWWFTDQSNQCDCFPWGTQWIRDPSYGMAPMCFPTNNEFTAGRSAITRHHVPSTWWTCRASTPVFSSIDSSDFIQTDPCPLLPGCFRNTISIWWSFKPDGEFDLCKTSCLNDIPIKHPSFWTPNRPVPDTDTSTVIYPLMPELLRIYGECAILISTNIRNEIISCESFHLNLTYQAVMQSFLQSKREHH